MKGQPHCMQSRQPSRHFGQDGSCGTMAPKGDGVKTSAHVGIEKTNRCFAIIWQAGVKLLGPMLLMLVFFAVAARAQNAASQPDKSAASTVGDAQAGKKLFIKDGCYECHGREGQGAAQASGPRIGPSQRFVRPFINYVRQPTGQMPPYTTAVISDQELADIYAYLQSRSRATPSKDIPLLNQ